MTECANAGEPSQEGRGFSPSDGVQIARELNNTGWTIGLGVGISSSNPVVSHTKKCVISCKCGKRLNPRPSTWCFKDIFKFHYSTVLFKYSYLILSHIRVSLFISVIMSKRIRLSLSAQEKQSTDWSKCFICQEDKFEALKSPPKKPIWQNQDTKPSQKISPSLQKLMKCLSLLIYAEWMRGME